jgi:signal transduction histidine kinase
VVDLKIIKINRSFTSILGLGEEVVGQRYLTVFPGSKAAGVFDVHLSVLKTGVPTEIEICYTGEGYDNWFRISITKSGENGLVQTFTDITESTRNKLCLQEAASHLQTVIDSTQTGIFLALPVVEDNEIVDFQFKTVNRALAAYANKQPEELIGGLHGSFFPVYKTNGVFEIYKRIFETGDQERFQQQYVADGFDVWMDVSAKKLGNDLLVTFHDYTSLKMLQLQLEASVHDLKKSNERLADFAYIASHDLKEPLRKVRMNADLLEQRYAAALGESGHQHLLRIQTAVVRMQTLITDLLAYSQISKKPDAFETVSLVDIVGDVVSDLETTIQATSAAIEIAALPAVKGDGTQLRQLFQNLLSNALKFTDPERKCHIIVTSNVVAAQTITTENLPHRFYYQIKVADNGIGFDPQYAEKIFRIFHRLHNQTEYEGTGIGLAIVQKVVENHQGLITATSEPGKGAIFSVYLPV